MRSVEFLYDFVSAPSYIAWTQIDALACEENARVTMTPVFCGAIFKAIGNPGPLTIPAKRAWYVHDLLLWAKKRGVPLQPNPHAPIRSLPLMRGIFVAEERGELARYMKAVWEATFVDRENISDPEVAKRVLAAVGIDYGAYLTEIEREDIKAKLRENTECAIRRGVFGVPSFFVGEELFFGQDRLEFVREALRSAAN